MPDDHVLWKPFPGMQTLACEANEDEIFLGGAKGPGKSDVVLFKALQQTHLPSFRAIVMREEFRQLEQLIARSHRIFPLLKNPPAWNGTWARWDFPNLENDTGAGGAQVAFRHCRTLEDAQKIQGTEPGYVGYDELGNVAEEAIWLEILKEIRCPDPRVVCQAIGSGNPGYAGHGWTKRRFIVPCGKDGSKIVIWKLTLPNGLEIERRRRFIPGRIAENPVYANDPAYLAMLWSLPEERRKALLEGDYDAAIGIALSQLNELVHIVPPFSPPSHWPIIGGFDWGFQHRWVLVWATVDEDGRIYVLDTLKGTRDLPHEIWSNIERGCPHRQRFIHISAGHDVWKVEHHRGDATPSIADELIVRHGLPMIRANQDRVHGLNNLRRYLAWQFTTPAGTLIEDDPYLFFMDTPGNRWLFEQLEDIVVDPDRPEYPLKIDMNPDTGQGGDDGFDAIRYMIASRAAPALPMALRQLLDPWDPSILAYEARVSRTVRNRLGHEESVGDPMFLEHIA